MSGMPTFNRRCNVGIERGQWLVKKWQPKFGLSDYRLYVLPLPEGGECFGESYFEPSQEWGIVWLQDDAAYESGSVQELTVLHELGHGILWNTLPDHDQSAVAVERFCNRIARLAANDWGTLEPDEEQALHHRDVFFAERDGPASRTGSVLRRVATKPTDGPGPSGNGQHAEPPLETRRWLNLILDSLPPNEREVANALYKEGLSTRQAAVALELTHDTLRHRQRRALVLIRERFAALEKSFLEHPDGTAD